MSSLLNSLAEVRLACLLQVFHFLYTYSVTVDICPFTLDELAQAFHDKVETLTSSFVELVLNLVSFIFLHLNLLSLVSSVCM